MTAQKDLLRHHHLSFCSSNFVLEKSNTTLKGLVGIATHCAVTSVSFYTKTISDREITRCSGILDLRENGDSVMADKGFDIEDLLRGRGTCLNLPPFLQDRRQFSETVVLNTKTIAKLQIHVERAIRRIKEYHFFDPGSFTVHIKITQTH